MKYIRNFFTNFFLLFLDTEKFISIFVNSIPKERFIETLRSLVEEEKKTKLGQIMHSISAQRVYIERLENYEKMLDVKEKNEGDFVIIWDFTSASYVNKTSDNTYEQVEPLCYLSEEEKNNFGKLMVYDVEHKSTLQLNETLALTQDLILSSVKDNKLVAVNALHTRII